MIRNLLAAVLLGSLLCIPGCGEDEEEATPASEGEILDSLPATGTLRFTANGEDFIRRGFVSKDGWSLWFDEAWVHVIDVAAMQTDPPYDPHQSEPPRVSVEVTLERDYVIDLADGPEDAAPITLASVDNAPSGHYNALSWGVSPAELGVTAPNAILLAGIAIKGEDTLSFEIGLDLECLYIGGEYVGDERKGLLDPGGVAEVEMTFHFDHIFGDADLPDTDALNTMAVGFQPFADLAAEDRVQVRMVNLVEVMDEGTRELLLDALGTLGHVGEGHCYTIVPPR